MHCDRGLGPNLVHTGPVEGVGQGLEEERLAIDFGLQDLLLEGACLLLDGLLDRRDHLRPGYRLPRAMELQGDAPGVAGADPRDRDAGATLGAVVLVPVCPAPEPVLLVDGRWAHKARWNGAIDGLIRVIAPDIGCSGFGAKVGDHRLVPNGLLSLGESGGFVAHELQRDSPRIGRPHPTDRDLGPILHTLVLIAIPIAPQPVGLVDAGGALVTLGDGLDDGPPSAVAPDVSHDLRGARRGRGLGLLGLVGGRHGPAAEPDLAHPTS
mmetsp:Transcript_135365/g.234773  ORF Transcript_135365/g.234773 Transcript_135365/m.234773 type:complete len:267 (-) Transcript_135365:1479-2279(-)